MARVTGHHPFRWPATGVVFWLGACLAFHPRGTAEPIITPPSITTQPQASWNGSSVTLAVEMAGTEPLAYSWLKDGTNLTDGGKISGATNASLTIAGVQPSDYGRYRVIVTNKAGRAESERPGLCLSPGLINFNTGPTATGTPGGARVWVDFHDGRLHDSYFAAGPEWWAQLYASPSLESLAPVGTPVKFRTGAASGLISGGTVTLSNVAAGQRCYLQLRAWRGVGNPLEGSDAPGLSQILYVQAGGLIVGNEPPGPPANLTGLQGFTIWYWAPSVETEPLDQAVAEGASATFIARVNVYGELRHSWDKDGIKLAVGGRISDSESGFSPWFFSLGVSKVEPNDTGYYDLYVWNSAGSARSRSARLAVQRPGREGGPTLIWIPAGTFTMGSPEAEMDRSSDEGPSTFVTLTRGFWMGQCEVTQGQWERLMGGQPSRFQGDSNRPVESVTWTEAADYCARLTERERLAGRLPAGLVYRLPTEAEWEYACRAGTATRFSYGDDPTNALLLGYAWYSTNSSNTTQAVGTRSPNRWQLYDMHGGVSEWCLDGYVNRLVGGQPKDPLGPSAGPGRVHRGGGWSSAPERCRSAARSWATPDTRSSSIGFRVVLAPALAPVPWILSTSYGFDGFSVQFRGWAGIRYAVEWSEDLDHWVGLQTVLSANGATEFIDPAARGRSKSFYRVRAEGGQY